MGGNEFVKQQMADKALEEIREKANKRKSFFEYKDLFIVRKTKDYRGLERVQLVIPVKFREGIVSACHENTAAHLGEKKTKDKLLRYFFWRNVTRQTDQICEIMRRVSENREIR